MVNESFPSSSGWIKGFRVPGRDSLLAKGIKAPLGAAA